MGGDKITKESNSTQKATPTAQEQRILDLGVEREEQAQSGRIEAQGAGLDLASNLLQGQDLPGFLSGLQNGISPEAIGHQAANLTRQNSAAFQNLGILDSGVAFKETADDIANNLLFPAEQFNIGNLQNLLNLALSGQAQVQSPIQAQSGQLGSSLAGLRQIDSSGSSTTTGMNPFFKSFQQSLGNTLGSPHASFAPGGFTGGFGGR